MLRAIKQVKRVFLFNWLEFSRDIQKERIKQKSEVSRVDIQIRVINVSNFNLFSYENLKLEREHGLGDHCKPNVYLFTIKLVPKLSKYVTTAQITLLSNIPPGVERI